MTSSIRELPVRRLRGQLDVYHLLGLPFGEADAVRIRAAVEAARELADELRQGRAGGETARLSSYVTEAERILTDAARKERYDASLARAMQDEGSSLVTRSVSEGERFTEPTNASLLERSPSLTLRVSTGSDADVSADLTRNCAPIVSGTALAAGHSPANVDLERPVASAIPLKAKPSVFVPPHSPSRSRDPLWERVVDLVKGSLFAIGRGGVTLFEMLHGGAPVRFSLACGFVVIVVGLIAWQVDWRAVFPDRGAAAKAPGKEAVTARLLPKAKSPTLANVAVGRKAVVPGLTEFAGYSPSLSGDLKIIVFVAEPLPNEAVSHTELMIATRDNVTDPFRKAERVAACCSDANEADVTLSPDGLELLFVRRLDGEANSLWHSLRSTTSSSFPEPTRVEIEKLPSGAEVTYEALQWVTNGGDLIVRTMSATPSGGIDAQYFVASRRERTALFESAKLLPTFVEQRLHHLTDGGRHAFIVDPHATLLSGRKSAETKFGMPAKLESLNPLMIGRPEGPIWVSPAEDVLFYSTTTTDRSGNRRRVLWQLRFR